MKTAMVLILDFGSQYTQLIARRVRERHIYCEIHPCTVSFDDFADKNIKAIILSGGPASVLEVDSPDTDQRFMSMDVPVLGICYGMQLITRNSGGKLVRSNNREYGRAEIEVNTSSQLFKGVVPQSVVWMSHGDTITDLPDGFKTIGSTADVQIAAIENIKDNIYCIQFHPEVAHTEQGKSILDNFLFEICGLMSDWTMTSFIERTVDEVKEKIGNNKVVLGISGGVDSAVAALLLKRAINDNLISIFVDNGLLRLNEENDVLEELEHLDLKIKRIDASDLFLSRLDGIIDPEQKRRIIGNTFIEVFEQEAKKAGDIKYLAQGTLYPDVIESVSFKGPSATIKSHS